MNAQGAWFAAFLRVATADEDALPDDLAALRRHLVTLTLAAEIAIDRGYVGEDGVDDGLLDAALGIRDLVDPGAS